MRRIFASIKLKAGNRKNNAFCSATVAFKTDSHVPNLYSRAAGLAILPFVPPGYRRPTFFAPQGAKMMGTFSQPKVEIIESPQKLFPKKMGRFFGFQTISARIRNHDGGNSMKSAQIFEIRSLANIFDFFLTFCVFFWIYLIFCLIFFLNLFDFLFDFFWLSQKKSKQIKKSKKNQKTSKKQKIVEKSPDNHPIRHYNSPESWPGSVIASSEYIW